MLVSSQLHPLLSGVSSQQPQMSVAWPCSALSHCCLLAAGSYEPSVSSSRQVQPGLQLVALRLPVLVLTCSVPLIFADTPGPKNDSIFCCLLVHMSRLMSFFVVNSRICRRAGAAQLWLLLVCRRCLQLPQVGQLLSSTTGEPRGCHQMAVCSQSCNKQMEARCWLTPMGQLLISTPSPGHSGCRQPLL